MQYCRACLPITQGHAVIMFISDKHGMQEEDRRYRSYSKARRNILANKSGENNEYDRGGITVYNVRITTIVHGRLINYFKPVNDR